jgi:hypothetical protein
MMNLKSIVPTASDINSAEQELLAHLTILRESLPKDQQQKAIVEHLTLELLLSQVTLANALVRRLKQAAE